jgi:hypothetical protein
VNIAPPSEAILELNDAEESAVKDMLATDIIVIQCTQSPSSASAFLRRGADMPQFAVITRSFRPSTSSERALDLEIALPVRLRPRHREPSEYIVGPARAYLIEADDARAAMRRVENLAAERGEQLMIHRAVEVAETLQANAVKTACAGSQSRR